MSRVHELDTPLTADAVAGLEVGDQVYLSGEVVLTAGLPTHRRILEYLDEGRDVPIDLRGTVLLQFGGMNREAGDGLEVVYMNPTTSTRFNELMPPIIGGYGLRAVGGKGGLDAACAAAMAAAGCVYLSYPGGLCTLYTRAIREVVAVEWRDLIPHYRLTKIRVDGLGPGTVGIDARGKSLYDGLDRQAAERMPDILARLDRERPS